MILYREVGIDYVNIFVTPRIQEDVKIVIACYTAEELIEHRQEASDAIYELIKSELEAKGINVISLAVENIDFTDVFEAAVEAKQVATQEKQRAQTEQEQKTMEAQQAAERKKIEANAAAEIQKIEADAAAYAVKVQAEAQATANKELAASLSNELIQYNTINNWDGKLPTVTTNDAMSIINLGGITNDE
jgi:regulator of protease activity HflC (stomatin/prohibitin superfamily)